MSRERIRGRGARALGAGALLLMLCVGGVTQAASYSGTVFEDANYGGGVGRTRVAAGGTVLANVRVELYRVSDGAFMAATTTNASGAYTLTTNGGNAGL